MHQSEGNARDSIARVLSEYYGELSGVVAKPAPKFSLARVVSGLAAGGLAGYEHEICTGASLVDGSSHSPARPIIPWSALARSMSTQPGSKGGYLVDTEVGPAADALRPYSVVVRAGARIMENLKADTPLPRTANEPTGNWLPGTVSDSDPALGSVSLTPKTYVCVTPFSLQFARQAEQSEPYMRQQLLAAAGRALDAAVLNGTGAEGQPLGVLNTPSIASQSGTSFDWDDATQILETLGNARLDDARAVWIAAPDTRKLLQRREKIATSSRFVWDDDMIANRAAYATADMPSATLLCGDWSQVTVGLWGAGLRLDVNPHQNFNTGVAAARVVLMMDVAVTQPTAFVRSSAIT